MKIPCFIVNRDRLHAPKAMVDYLNQIDELQVIIIDNDSAYEPLLEWYETKPCIIHRLTANYGSCSPLFSPPECVEGHEKPDFFAEYNCTNGYILTDPDLKIDHIPKDFMSVLREGFKKYTWATKVGFQIDTFDLPDTPVAKEARQWEFPNQSRGESPIYTKAPIDTTFALYKWLPELPRLAHDFDRSIRCESPYSCKHIPWYYTAETIPEDEKFYINRITAAMNHYSIRLRRMINGEPINQA